MCEELIVAEFLPEVGAALSCQANHTHEPKPLRFVWHHIVPRICGGQTVADNLASVCDNCHYGIHAILYDLARNGGTTVKYKHMISSGRYDIALRGYQGAVATGTVASVPNEGSD